MKNVRRNGIFETNSSSVHGISFNADCPINPGNIELHLDEFGWHGGGLGGDYLYTAIWQLYGASAHEKFEIWKERIRNACAAKGIDVLFEAPSQNFYYVDHVDELDDLLNMLEKDSDLLVGFICHGWVDCTNDNEFDFSWEEFESQYDYVK